MNDLNDLWPDFDVVKQDENEENNALKILREQARILGKKSGNKVKATFSKIHYREVSSGFSSALTAMAAITAASQTKTEEVLEDDLTGKTNISDVLREQLYKFEIYNEKYRFRLFVYTYSPIYPNKISIDENIAKDIETSRETYIESDRELIDLLTSVYSSQRVKRIIRMMILNAEKKEKKRG